MTGKRSTHGRDGAIWDKKASQALGFNFILVGDQISYAKQIMNFNCTDKALALIGL